MVPPVSYQSEGEEGRTWRRSSSGMCKNDGMEVGGGDAVVGGALIGLRCGGDMLVMHVVLHEQSGCGTEGDGCIEMEVDMTPHSR